MSSIKSLPVWSFRGLLACIVLLLLMVAWIIQLVVFSPLLVWALLIGGKNMEVEEAQPVTTGHSSADIVFDRLMDASKLYGCNTRNVRYRWTIFVEALASVKRSLKGGEVVGAMDFGAGSLRETYELARLGFAVTAHDLNQSTMDECAKFYDWSYVRYRPVCVSGTLDEAAGATRFHVITAFDVIEHLFEPETVLSGLLAHLAENGILLVTVPNRRSLLEKVDRFRHYLRMKRGKIDRSGIPHVQFRTPEEWSRFFEAQGFSICKHDMAIGNLVNNAWAGLYGLPVRVFIEPVVRKAANLFGCAYRKFSFERIFYPSWLMVLVDRLDQRLKPLLHNRWGRNLFVLNRR